MNEEIKPLRIFIGWDSREDIAYQVCRQSILDTASVPVEIIPLKRKALIKKGMYQRDEDALASTEFTFTRFLLPELCSFEGWALFIDCDVILKADIKELFDQVDDQYAIMCVHHNYTPKEGVKMDGKQQLPYPRKNWSSMMLINCGHDGNKIVTKEFVNDPKKTGAFLHRFSWLPDSEIGKISHEWNWLVGWYNEPMDGIPKLIHYTDGGPWFPAYEDCDYAADYYRVERRYLSNLVDLLKEKKQVVIDDLALTDQKKLIKETLKNLIDPNENFHKNTKENIKTITENSMGNKVAAIDSAGGINYNSKGYSYDELLNSFILGTGGKISNWDKEKDTDNDLVIRGLCSSSQKAITHCWNNNRTFYAIDTGYFGNGKNKFWHRITKNNLQHLGPILERPDNRLKMMKYARKKFTNGTKILICPPSEKVMNLWGQPAPVDWTRQVIEELKQYTDRPIEVRLKPTRSERTSNKSIEMALADDVYCLITYNSIAATEALMNGKPAIALGPNVARSLCNTLISQVENLNIPTMDEMHEFVCHLSYAQFNHIEMQNGTAWRIINESS